MVIAWWGAGVSPADTLSMVADEEAPAIADRGFRYSSFTARKTRSSWVWWNSSDRSCWTLKAKVRIVLPGGTRYCCTIRHPRHFGVWMYCLPELVDASQSATSLRCTRRPKGETR